MTIEPKFKHILIAEDNDFNQDVAVELLTEAGYTVTVTNNGQELLDTLLSNPENFFDLILMDLEMPILDGHQSTIQIRSRREFDHIPIIAMTAHNLDSTKNQCAKEGMQDFLSKPFEPHTLNQVLEKWLSHEHEKTIIKKDSPINTMSDFESGIKQLRSIDAKRGLQLSGHNAQLYRKLLQRFAESQETSLLKLQNTTESDLASTDFKRLLHTLKGLSGTIGAEQLASEIAQFESLLENPSRIKELTSIASQGLDRIANLLESTIIELLGFLSSLHEIEPIPEQISNTKTAQVVEKLVSLLNAADPEAIDFFQIHSSEFSGILLEKDFLALTDAIENYEFDLANSLLSSQSQENNVKKRQS